MKRPLITLALAGLAALAGIIASAAEPLLKIDGSLSNVKNWNYIPPTGGTVLIPFEGRYEDKGGRVVSPRIRLDKKRGEHAFYRIDFTARTGARCYWWIDFFDFNGNPLPDCNSAVYPGPERRYSEVFMASAEADEIQVLFSSSEGVSVKDIVLTRISDREAAEWCDSLLKEIPGFAPELTPLNNEYLPKTRDALLRNKPFHILMLGDSIVNDTWTSNFIALFNRLFPENRIRFSLSVRGTTGCWYYQEPEHFQEYVARYKPDLVIIGGVSNWKRGTPVSETEKQILSVAEQCRAIEAEVLLTTPPASVEWRTSPDDTAWPYSDPQNRKNLNFTYQKKIAEEKKLPLWDLTNPVCSYIASSRRDLEYFRRDPIHNNDRGKQLIGRTLVGYFQLLASSRPPQKEKRRP